MAEVASGHVTLYPKLASGFKAGMQGPLADAGQASGTSTGKMFAANLGAILVGGAIKKVVGGFTNTVRGAMRGGMDRLMNIEQAQIKLRTLGIDVEAAMASVNTAVDGTKFAISDAADMAAQLGAGGMEAGAEMTKWLTLTADAAQFAGVEFSDMQGLLQQVALDGRVMGDTFNRFPLAVSALAEHLGVSNEEVRKMGRDGQISADMLQEALDAKIGGAAKNAGESFLSMAANIRTALNATAANLLSPVVDAAKPVMEAFLPVVKQMRDAAGGVGEAIGDWLQPKAEALAVVIGELPAKFSAWWDSLQSIREAGSGLFDGVMDAVTGFVDGLGGLDRLKEIGGPLLTLAQGPLGILRAALGDTFGGGGVDVAGFAEGFGSALGGILGPVSELASALLDALVPAVADLLPVLASLGGTVLSTVADLFAQLAPVVAQIAQGVLPVLAGVLGQLVPMFASLISTIAPLIAMLVSGLVPVIMQIVSAVLPPLISIFSTVVGAIMQIVAAIMPLIETLLTALIPVILNIVSAILPPLIEILALVAEIIVSVVVPIILELVNIFTSILVPAINILLPIVTTIFNGIAQVIGIVLNLVAGIIKTVMAVLRGDWSGAWNAIKDTASKVWDGIKSLIQNQINAARDIVASVVGRIRDHLSQTWNSIKSNVSEAWASLKSTITERINDVVALVRGLPQRVRDALGDLGNFLKGAGRALLRGFTNGIKEGIQGAVNAAKGGLGRVRNLFPFSPAKEGPLSGSGYVDRSGRALVEDFAAAIDAGQGRVAAAASRISEAARVSGSVDDVDDMRPRKGVAALGRQIVFNSHTYYPQEEPSSVKERRLLEHAAAMGLV